MKKFKIVILFSLLVITLTLSSLISHANQERKNVDVKITSIFKDDTISNTVGHQQYGTKVAFDSNLPSDENFAFWIHNGVVKNVSKDYEFIITEKTELQAVFTPDGEYAVMFMDANGKLLNVQWIEDGKKASDSEITLPNRPGYQVLGWDKSLDDPITNNTIFTLQYEEVENPNTFNLSVINGNGSGTFKFNEVVTVNARETRGNMHFSHWQIGNSIVSKQPTYSFTILSDTEITAVYTDEAANEDLPFVTLRGKENIRDGYDSYIGQFYLPNGYELIEFGMLTADTETELALDTVDLNNRHEGFVYVNNTNEWLMSFTPTESVSVRAYLVCENENGNLITFYSESIKTGVLTEDLFFSEYIEGSSNNKAIEIFNGTGTSVDLSSYTIELYTNGSTSAGQTHNLTGILENNDVYVIANSSAGSEIKAVQDITSAVTSFNGDDVLVLKKGDTIIDTIGTIGDEAKFAENVTLVRNANVLKGNDTYDQNEWTTYESDTFDYLGSHEIEGSAKPIVIFPESIEIIGETTVSENLSIDLTANVYPENAVQDITWSSSDENIATVVDGKVTGINPGTVTIKATSTIDDQIFGTIDITVEESSITMYVETFDNYGNTSSSYLNSTFIGVNGIEWTVTGGRGNLGGYDIDGAGIMFKAGSIEASFTGGISSFSVDLKMGYTGGSPSDREAQLYINDTLIDSYTLSGYDTETFTVDNLNVTGDFTIKLVFPSSRQIVIDNLTIIN